MRKLAYIFSLIVLLIGAMSNIALATDKPITTDRRIKTFIYNENEVFKVIVQYGYQCSIEFSNSEEVSTISAGDTYAWKLTPIGRRLFVKPMQNNIHTNMTVITNKRTYQFDLLSKELQNDDFDSDIVYVLRFFYPSDKTKAAE